MRNSNSNHCCADGVEDDGAVDNTGCDNGKDNGTDDDTVSEIEGMASETEEATDTACGARVGGSGRPARWARNSGAKSRRCENSSESVTNEKGPKSRSHTRNALST